MTRPPAPGPGPCLPSRIYTRPMPLMASVVDHINPGSSMPISRARHALLGSARSAFTTTYAHHTPSLITLSRPWNPFHDLLRPAVSPQVPDRSLGALGCLPLRCRIAAALRRIQRRETFEVTSDRNPPRKQFCGHSYHGGGHQGIEYAGAGPPD